MNVGFIGLGRMGAAMAGNLLWANHDVPVSSGMPAQVRRRF
jgi:3-hydroxyisobutyrate dehydrogenase-like beta-hydroxyacid dehydrogenase